MTSSAKGLYIVGSRGMREKYRLVVEMKKTGYLIGLRQRQPRPVRASAASAVKGYLLGILQARVSGKTGAYDPSARFIWDKNKLAWVENPKAAVMQGVMEVAPKENKIEMPSAVTKTSDSEKPVRFRKYLWDGSKIAWVENPKAAVEQSPKEEAPTVNEVKTTPPVETTSEPKTLVSPRKRATLYPRRDS